MVQTHKFNPVSRDRLFFDSYQYCVSFYLEEVSVLKVLDHKHIDAVLNRRRTWREGAQARWASIQSMGQGLVSQAIMRHRWRDITPAIETNVHTLAETLLTTSIDFKLTTSVDRGWLYTNNTLLFDRLIDLQILDELQFTEARITRPRNTIVLKKSKHTHRSYFKNSKLSEIEKQNLDNFLTNQQAYLKISPSLVKWLQEPYLRTQDYFFVDHTGENWLLMLSLVQPGLIRKTLEIIPA